jgi:hypothetical protein
MSPAFTGELNRFTKERKKQRKEFNQLLRKSFTEFRPLDTLAPENQKLFGEIVLLSLFPYSLIRSRLV